MTRTALTDCEGYGGRHGVRSDRTRQGTPMLRIALNSQASLCAWIGTGPLL
ncbi:hypothetical protein [Paenibacillus sp. 843]|uniref:hypothetical protein n=1 Tax=Paenibacillus sp. 843 TaxID=3341795 RepID=UPI00372D1600